MWFFNPFNFYHWKLSDVLSVMYYLISENNNYICHKKGFYNQRMYD